MEGEGGKVYDGQEYGKDSSRILYPEKAEKNTTSDDIFYYKYIYITSWLVRGLGYSVAFVAGMVSWR